MDPFVNVTDMELQSWGYNDRNDFDSTVESARQAIGEQVFSLDPLYLKKSILSSYGAKPNPIVSTPAPVAKPVAVQPIAPVAKTQEQIRLQSERKPDDSKAKLYSAAQAAYDRANQVALAEGTALTDTEKQAVLQQVGKTLAVPRAQDGSATWSPLASLAETAGAPAKIVEALKPQQILSSSQVSEIDKGIATRKQQGEFDAINYYREHPTELAGVSEADYLKAAKDWSRDFQNWSPAGGLYSMENIARAAKNKVLTGQYLDPELTKIYEEHTASGGDKALADPRAGVMGAISAPTESGALYETPLFATLRGLILPEAIVGGTISPTDTRPWLDSVSERLKKGEGLETSGSEIARYLGAEPGSTADSIGWWSGLGLGFLLPIDLGVSDLVGLGVKGAGKVVGKGIKIATGLDEATNLKRVLALSDADAGALKSASPAIVDLREVAIRNADLIEEPSSVARIIAQVDVDELAKLTDDDLPAYIKSKVAQVVPASEVDNAFNTFIARAQALGLNELTGSIAKGTTRAATELPIGDTVLAWQRYIKRMEATLQAEKPGSKAASDLRRVIAGDIVKRRISEAVANGQLPGRELTMLTPTTAIPTDTVPRFLSEIRQRPAMQALADAQTSGGITPAAIEALSSIPKSVFAKTDLFNAIRDAKEGRLPADAINLNRAEVNRVIDNVVGYYASKFATGETITDLATTGKRLEQAVASQTKPSQKIMAAITKLNLEQAFNPIMLRPTGFRKAWRQLVSPVLVAYAPAPLQRKIMTPMESYARTTLVTRLGALDEVYKADYDMYLRQGKTQDEALAATIFNQFNANPLPEEDLWVNFMSALYGGYDSVTELQILRSGTRNIDLQQKAEYIAVFTDIFKRGEGSVLGELAAAYRAAPTQAEKLKALAVSARILEGRPLGDFVKSTAGAPATIRTIANKQPLFSHSFEVPLYAAYVQRYQANAMLEIRTQLLTSTGVVRPTSVDTALSVAEKQAAAAIEPLLKAGMGLEDVKLWVVEDYIYHASQRVTSSPPTHVSQLRKRLIERETEELSLDVVDESKAVDVLDADVYGAGRAADRTIEEIESDVDFAIETLGYHRVGNSYTPNTIQSPGDIVLSTLTGQSNVALTEEELRAWAYSLAAQAENTFRVPKSKAGMMAKADAEAGSDASVYSLLDSSGLYDLSEITNVVKGSVPLKETEEAFLAYDYLRDVRYLGSLPDNVRADVIQTLTDATKGYTARLTEALAKVSGPDITLSQELSMMLQQGAVASEVGDFVTSTLPGFIKNNLLGGGWLPNPVYHFQNFISGPMIMAMTLTKRQSVFSFMYDYGILGNRTFTAPNGKVYTNGMLTNLMIDGGVNASTVKAEIRTNMLRDMISYGGNLIGPVEMKRGFFKNLVKYAGFDGLSTWNQLASHMDLAYRKKAMVDALKEGLSEPQALEVARKALFDYNELTGWERASVAKYMWFYRFMRQNLVQTTLAFLDNPSRTLRLIKMSKFGPSKIMTGHINPDIQEYKDSKPFLTLLEGQDKRRLAIYAPSMPVLEATARMLDTMAFFGVMAQVIKGDKPDSLTIQKSIENMVQGFSLNPVMMAAELGIQKSFGITVKLDDNTNQTWLDPKFVAYLKATEQWQSVLGFLDIEMVADDPRVGITTFDGYYYKIQPESELAWKAMMETLKVVGLQRTMRDYATLLQTVDIPGMEAGTDIKTDPSLDILRTLGIISVGSQPTVEQAQEQVRKDIIYSLPKPVAQ